MQKQVNLRFIMRRLLYISIFVIFILGCFLPAMADGIAPSSFSVSRTITFHIYYPINQITIREDYMDNADHLRHLREYMASASCIDSIIIRSYASPEGPYWLNKRYAEQRGEAVYDYL